MIAVFAGKNDLISMSYQPKLALVHDDLVQQGGAEMLFEEIASIYPDAPIYTSLVDWSKIPSSINKNRIHTSFIQKIPFAQKFYKAILPLYPLAFESFNLDDFDIVISSTTRFAKSTITKPKTVHICYINSVPRFLYNQNIQKHYLSNSLAFILSPYFSWLKRWDKAASKRPDLYIANSQNVKNQVKKIYGRESVVIYPFVDTEFFCKKYQKGQGDQRYENEKDYCLVVSRLNKWKRIEIAIQACLEHKINLKIVGTGPDEERLKKLAIRGQRLELRGQIQFLGNVRKDKLRELYQNAKALIVTQEEDFGIAAVEAQACGTSVIAFNAGGAKETVINGKTGLFFDIQNEKSLKDAILAHSRLKWDSVACRRNALKFSKKVFRQNLTSVVKKYVH